MTERGKKRAIKAAKWAWGVAMALLAAWLFLVKTGPGHSLIADAVARFADIRITGLSGSLPNRIRADRVEFLDADGVWLSVDKVELDWDAWAILADHIDIQRLTAERAQYLRPQRVTEPSETTLVIDIASLDVKRLDMTQAAIGEAASLTAQGSLHYVSLSDIVADINARQLDGDGQYRINAAIRGGKALGDIDIREGSNGIAGGLMGLTTLGPMVLMAQGTENGPQNRIAFDLKASTLTATGQGTINLNDRTADVAFTAASPALSPRPGLSWQGLNAQGAMEGSFDRPIIDADVRIEGLVSGDIAIKSVTAEVQSNNGILDAVVSADGVVLPGDAPNLLAGAPIRLVARVDMTQATRPVTYSIAHPVLQANGTARTLGAITSETIIDLPRLAAFDDLTGSDLAGRGRFTVKTAQNQTATNVTIDGTINAQGSTATARLLGNEARINAMFETDGASIAAARAEVNAAAVTAHLSGTSRNNALDYRWDVALSDVSRLAPTLLGTLRLEGTYSGTPSSARATARGEAYIGTSDYMPQRVALTADIRDLPRFGGGDLRLSGRFQNAPVDLRLDLARNGAGALAATLQPTSWKGINARGQVTFATASTPMQGDIVLRVAQLGDIAPLLGVTASGSVDATINFRAAQNRERADISLVGRNIAYDTIRADTLTATGTVNDPLGTPQLDLALTAANLQTQDYAGRAELKLSGPFDRIALALTSEMTGKTGDNVTVKAEGRADTKASAMALQSASAVWQEKIFSLAGPASIHYGDGIVLDRLSLEQDGARIDLNGRVVPALDVTVAVSNVTAETLRLFVPQLALDGSFTGTAELDGRIGNPDIRFDIAGTDLRPKGITARGFTDTTLKASGTLRNQVVTFSGTLAGGKSLQLNANGSLALGGLQEINLNAKGDADLAMLNPLFSAGGQSLAGTIMLDGAVTGTLSQPVAIGSAKLSGGEYRDYARGIRLQNMEGNAEAAGSQIRVTRLTATAGNGTITGNGTIDLAAPGIPVALTLTARNARPLTSDLVTATMHGDMKIEGTFQKRLLLSGSIDVLQGEIKIPDKLPPQVAVLDVRRKGQAPPQPAAPMQGVMALDITVTAAGRTFVRGRGIDVDLGGSLHITGTVSQPTVQGGLEMRRGTLSIAGRTLSFTSGKVSFDGAGLKNRIDPTLDLAAETNSSGITARLAITGYASAPRVILSSTPTLPQDEVIARLLFQQSVKQLTPLQLAEIAQAIAALGGVGTGFNPIGSLRESLGLDRLSIGSTPSSTGEQSTPTIDAGKYISRNVYVGATQDLSGRTKAIVEVDITKNLKAQATVTTGTGTATTGAQAAQGGDSIGLTYQFDY